jgi:hypothetical protein
MSGTIWVTAGIRLIKMVVELHRRGYQHLRICPYEYPLAWRLEIAPNSEFSSSNGAFRPSTSSEPVRYSSASETSYFGWAHAAEFDSQRLAKEFETHFRELCEAGAGRDCDIAVGSQS